MAKNIFINQAEISHYLKDVRKIKVLTKEREKELAKQMNIFNIHISLSHEEDKAIAFAISELDK